MSALVLFDEFVIIFSKGWHASHVNNLFSLSRGFRGMVMLGYCFLTHMLAPSSWAPITRGSTNREQITLCLYTSPTRQPGSSTSCCTAMPRGTKKIIIINKIYSLLFIKGLICRCKCGPWSCKDDAPASLLCSARSRGDFSWMTLSA